MIPQTQEQYSSHIPALHILAALGYFSFPCSCVGTHVEAEPWYFRSMNDYMWKTESWCFRSMNDYCGDGLLVACRQW